MLITHNPYIASQGEATGLTTIVIITATFGLLTWPLLISLYSFGIPRSGQIMDCYSVKTRFVLLTFRNRNDMRMAQGTHDLGLSSNM